MRSLALSAVLSFLLALALATPVLADYGDCGQPRSVGDHPVIADVLYILSSVSYAKDCPLDMCDVDGDCEVTLRDALAMIQHILDRDVDLRCDSRCDDDGDRDDDDEHRRFCGRSEAPTCGGWCPEDYSCEEIERGDRVKICHKPWWNKSGGHTIEVSEHAVRAHLRHGDYVGECGSCERDECDKRDKKWDKKKKKKDKKRKKHDKKREKKHGKKGKKHGKHEDWRGFGCRCARVPDSTTTTTMRPTTTTTMRPTTTTTTVVEPTTTTTVSTTTTSMPAPSGDADNDGILDEADPCRADPRNLCVGSVAMDETTGSEIRVNANVSGAPCSGTKVDCSGATWFADFGYNRAESSFSCVAENGCPIAGVDDLFGCTSEATQDLFRCEHWDPEELPELTYSFDVPNGIYVVNTFWANIFPGTAEPGARLVRIIVEGQTVYPSFDQMLAAGATQTAVVRSAIVPVADGNGLQIVLGHVVEHPGIKAIEVLKVD